MDRDETRQLEAGIDSFSDHRQRSQIAESFHRQAELQGYLTRDQIVELFQKQSNKEGFLSRDQINDLIANYCLKNGYISAEKAIEVIGKEIGIKLQDSDAANEFREDNRWVRKTRKILDKAFWWAILGVGGFIANYIAQQHWK
jgi:hypothetical protein